jgi:hypothetical protein
MGQAKQRGTLEQRIQQSLARKSKLQTELEALPDGVTKKSLQVYGVKHGTQRLMLKMVMAQMIPK